MNTDTGVFEINNVFPGSYVLMANQQAPDPNLAPMSARQRIDVTDRPLQVRLMMQKAVDIPVSLVIEGDRAVQPRQVNFQIMEVGQSMGIPPRVEMQPDGSFLMKNVSPGIWRMAAFGPNVFLRAIEVDGQTTQGHILETSKGIVGPLRFFISTRMATIQAKGNAGLAYTLTQDDGDSPYPRSQMANADPQGRVQMQGLVPGKYKIFEGSAPDDTMLLQTVTVTEGMVLNLDLSKRPSGVGNPR